MPSRVNIASPRQQTKAKNARKSRLTPKQCRGVTDHWKYCLGEDKARALVGKYTNPTRLPSTKGISYRVDGSFTHHLQQDWSVSSAHSDTGGRRNPGRNDGLAWNGDSFICTGRIDTCSDYSDLDPLSELCPICEELYEREAILQRPRTTEITLADVPAKFCKPKRPKAHGYEVLKSVPQVSSVPPSEVGEPSVHHDSETMSNISWDAMTSDDLGVLSEEDWEDLGSTLTLDNELDRYLKLLRVARNDSNFPFTTPPRMTYAQVLGEKSGKNQK